MERFKIEGPVRLQGTVRASGAKNAALPSLAATLLTDDPVRLLRLPNVRDIRTMCKLLEHLGSGCDRSDGEGVRLQHTGEMPSGADAPYDLVKTMRASILVLGPILARRGQATVSLPGGCAIGNRPIEEHLKGMEALGAKVTLEGGYVTVEAAKLRGTKYRFETVSVTGTENVMMAAVLARGTTVLENAAREAEIADLAALLNKMGARISGAGTDRLEIEGVETLHGATHEIVADRIEAGTYLVGGVMTGGDVTVEGASAEALAPLLEKLEEAGAKVESRDGSVRAWSDGKLKPALVETSPHPGFPTDLQAQFMALMTQAEGVSTVREFVFENRFQHVSELNRLGADIRVRNRTAKIRGRTKLSGARVMATDLRASASLVLAGCAAKGTTVVDRIYHLDRGYESMESKLQSLGAQVERQGGGED